MDIPAVFASILQEGGTTAVALLALYMLNSVYRYILDRERAYAAEIREDKAQVLRVMGENTAALTRLTSIVESWVHDTERTIHGKSTGN